MSNFDLPIIRADAHPEFNDAAGCAEWLQSLPLINVGPSHGRLLGEIEQLNCFNVPIAERIKILELLREPILFVQGEHSKKFASRAVPFTRPEREIFSNVLALWDALAYGWQHCLHALGADAPGLSAQAALICERSLWCVGQKIAEHYRAYQQVRADEWRRAHRIYHYAESRGVSGETVPHAACKPDADTTCAGTYAHILLLALANPNEHTPRQQMHVARWLDRWARKVSIARDAAAGPGIAPLSVDLESGAGASRETKTGSSIRFLELDEVAKSVKKRLALLRSGQSPESLGLGIDVPPGLAAQMLGMLYQQWCEGKSARHPSRRPASRDAQLCPGLPAIHYYVTGKPFRQPSAAAVELTKRQREEIATFGRTSVRAEDSYVAAQVAALENWNITEESLAGMRLERAVNAGPARFMHQQLVAVRPADARSFMLAAVRSLSVTESEVLQLGTRLLPGVPQGVAVRPTGVNVSSEKFIPALALPAVPALQTPATLLLPMGWYRPKRVIEVHTDRMEKLLLSGVVERGNDYERCTFEPA
ncbi:MAG: hypothetical protein A3I01_07545 [Betaproteobacteria bacterium RIFCSPLOWO2_02_FULL_65_24]|nr:MAG: hypothetical protein A3I01_07545 [Betaproteobacteria bacterium RIFCSPLOWO2_02_FULL_65_24]